MPLNWTSISTSSSLSPLLFIWIDDIVIEFITWFGKFTCWFVNDIGGGPLKFADLFTCKYDGESDDAEIFLISELALLWSGESLEFNLELVDDIEDFLLPNVKPFKNVLILPRFANDGEAAELLDPVVTESISFSALFNVQVSEFPLIIGGGAGLPWRELLSVLLCWVVGGEFPNSFDIDDLGDVICCDDDK